MLALDAEDVSKQLWTSELAGTRDRLGLFAKFVPPTVAGGKVFVATYGDTEPLKQYVGNAHPQQTPARYYVAVYGKLPPAHDHPAPTIVNQDQDDVTVTKAVATTAITLDTSKCVPTGTGNLDCTDALAAKFGAPAFHDLVVPVGYTFAGPQPAHRHHGQQAGRADGVDGDRLVRRRRHGRRAGDDHGALRRDRPAQEGRRGTAQGGGPAVLNQFVGVANCPVGTGSYDKIFKPFMQFENSPDGRVFRNWDPRTTIG